MEELLGWEWSSFFQIIIGAGFRTALVQATLPLLSERGQRRRQASYLAMRLAVALEAYAADCYDLIQYNRHAPHLPDEEFPEWRVKLPDLPTFPEDTDGWLVIDRRLAARCLDLGHRARQSQAIIEQTIEYIEHEIYDAVEEQAASRGLDAWRLAQELRHKHGVASAGMIWNFAESLRNIEREVEKRKREKAAKRAR